MREWANAQADIEEVYLFGSRVKGDFEAESDLDVGVVVLGKDPVTAWIVNAGAWRLALNQRLPVQVDLQFCDFQDDEIVGPSVQDHGVRIFARNSENGGKHVRI